MSSSQYFNLTEINLANWFKIFIDIAILFRDVTSMYFKWKIKPW